jgi:hypothetical protein
MVDYVGNIYKYQIAFKAIVARQERQEQRTGAAPSP